MQKSKYTIVITAELVSCIVLLGAGCSRGALIPVAKGLPTPTSSPSVSQESTPKATNTLSPTSSPILTQTATRFPTLSPDEARQLVGDLFRTNRGCLLPCWWGFVPGKTPWLEAERFLEQFAYLNPFVDQTQLDFDIDVMIPVPEETFPIPLQQVYRVEEGIITSMEIQIGNTPEYALPLFLQTYGPPGEIWLSTYSTEYPPGVLPFLVVLFYPERGILAVYGPRKATLVGDQVRGCQWDNPPSMFGLWSPRVKMTFMEAAVAFRLNPYEPGFLLLPIEQATAMDVQVFYETYRRAGSSVCLETPRELWPEQY